MISNIRSILSYTWWTYTRTVTKIISQVQNRFDKQYKPREEEGILKRYSDITQVDMSEGNWLVLSSANHFLDDVKDLCELTGMVLSIQRT